VAVGARRRGDDDAACRRMAARTSGGDVAAGRESRRSGGQDATVSAFYLTGTAHTAQAGPPRPCSTVMLVADSTGGSRMDDGR